jgi:hypothetical protein
MLKTAPTVETNETIIVTLPIDLLASILKPTTGRKNI